MAHITFDYSKVLDKFVAPHEVDNLQAQVTVADEMIRKGTGPGADFLGWRDLPENYDREEFDRILKAAEKIKEESDVLVVIGIGDGFAVSHSVGSTNNDPFCIRDGKTVKKTNHSGGTLGGMSDGSDLILRAAVKPTPSIAATQHTVNEAGEEIDISIHGRHDPVIVPRAVVVVEAMTALTLADLLLCNTVSTIDKIKKVYEED